MSLPDFDRAPAGSANDAPDTAAFVQSLTEAFEAQSSNMLVTGDRAPGFRLPDATGRLVTLEDRLASGPVVLLFYRDGNCPTCKRELRAYQRRLPTIQAAGAQLIAISPQAPDESRVTAATNALHFDLLSDAGAAVAAQYGVLSELASFVVDTKGHIVATNVNGADQHDPDGVIASIRALDQGGSVAPATSHRTAGERGLQTD